MHSFPHILPCLTSLFICIFNVPSPLCLRSCYRGVFLSWRVLLLFFLHCISFYCFRSGFFLVLFLSCFRIFVVLNFPRDSPYGNILFLSLLSSAVNRFGEQARPAADYTTPTQARLHITQLLTRITQLANLILGIRSRQADSVNQLLHFSLFNATLRPFAPFCCTSCWTWGVCWCWCWQQVVGSSNTSRDVCEQLVAFPVRRIPNRPSPFDIQFGFHHTWRSAFLFQ